MAPHATDAELVLLAEQLDRPATALDRLGAQRLLLLEVRRRLDQPVVGEPDHEERHEHDAPALQLLQERRLERRVGRPRLHGRRDVRRRLARDTAAQDQGHPGGEDEHDAQDEEDHPRGIAQRQHVLDPVLSLARGHAERSLRGFVDRVGATRRSEDHDRRVHHHVAVLHLHHEAVHAARRRTQLVLAGEVVLGAVTRTLEPLATNRRTARDIRGARIAGTAA